MVERLLTGLVVLPFLLGAAAAPTDRAEVLFSFQDRAIVESSGLALHDGLVLTVNDSGDSGRVFVVDPADGETVGVTTWSEDPSDVEALAPAGDGTVWVGDIGDNSETRDTLQLAEVPVGRGDRTVDPVVYDLAYPDGGHDAETLMADPVTGRLYVASKGVLGNAVYAAPARLDPDRPNRLTLLGEVLPFATDGAFFPDGKHVVVRNYGAAAVYAFPSLERLATLRLPAQQQGEGIAVDDRGRLLLSSEGLHAEVLRVTLPADVRTAVLGTAPPSGTTSSPPDASPTPGAGSREDRELPETTRTDRDAWPWVLSGLIGLAVVVVLVRSLRRS